MPLVLVLVPGEGSGATCGVVRIQARPCNEYPDVNTTHPISPHPTESTHMQRWTKPHHLACHTCHHLVVGVGGHLVPCWDPKVTHAGAVTQVLLHVTGGETQVPTKEVKNTHATPHETGDNTRAAGADAHSSGEKIACHWQRLKKTACSPAHQYPWSM